MIAGHDCIGVGIGALTFDSKGRIFLAKRGEAATNERGYWEFPGGRLEFGERLIDGVRREFREEYEMDICVVHLLGAFDHILAAEQQHWVAVTFIACHRGGTPRILEPNKCSAIGWFGLGELPQPLSQISRHNLKAYNSEHGQRSDWCTSSTDRIRIEPPN
jgi:ADP-ribose pyrophosphatase YjhB (NUDIX family)